MSKVNLNDVGSGFNLTEVVNSNNDTIEEAFDNTLSRDGSTPNGMDASIDMNSHPVLNLGAPVGLQDAARWADVLNGVVLTGTAVPSQVGNSGKSLTTNGTSPAWTNPAPYIARTSAEIAASFTPTDFQYPINDVRRANMAFDNSTNITSALSTYLAATDNTISGAMGTTLLLPQGTGILSSSLNIPNRTSIKGVNKRGSVLKASGHTGPYVFTVTNGTSGGADDGSMFDNRLQDLNIDCNDVAGLGGVLADAWQEGGGMRDVLVNKFRTFGVKFQNGDGGASLCTIKDCEIFGSTSNATAGIYADISASAAFMLKVENTSIAGGGPTTASLPRGIHMIGASLTAINVHFEVLGSGIYLDGAGNHVLINCTGASASSGIDNLVEIASTFTGTVTMIGCFRNGATNFLKDNRVGGLGTITGRDPRMLRIAPVGEITDESPGAIWSAGSFNGNTVGTNAPDNGYNCTSVQRESAGTYLVTETRARPNAACAPLAQCNLSDAIVKTAQVGAASFRITIRVAGVATDSGQVSFHNIRLA